MKETVMRRNMTLSNIALGIITITMMISLVPLAGIILFDSSVSLLCTSFFLIFLEIEFFILCFIPNWKLFTLLKGNITNKQFRLTHFLTAIPFLLIGGYMSWWSASKLYLEIKAVLKDYRAGIFTYYEEGKCPDWVTYSINSDDAEFTADAIMRCFFAGSWGFLLEFGILLITVAFAFIIRPTFRNT
ncbi:hypothetical protein [Chryseobacterium sp. KLBC 52]|uniref:hypothetical protein n=1 Tax=Chryseobacterium sp. KLBC 52 TaxID=1862702 RepID=UPI000E0A12E9|nr:hypothetical protein [Chryseobacterium sp. KLBC 52]